MQIGSHRVIGQSSQGRDLVVQFAGTSTAATRVFILAGQHGDEPLAREAACAFLKEYNQDAIHLAVLADANPDGSARKRRRNADNIDLNRDHQRLQASETFAMHQFIRNWRPQMVVDVHTYPPRRKHLLKRGLVHCNDVFIDIANNPTACENVGWNVSLGEALPRWIERVRSKGFRCDRYTLVKKNGRVRHSTPDVIDARNGIALRFGIPTLLLEGREPTRFDSSRAALQTLSGLVAALHAACLDAPALAIQSECGKAAEDISIRSIIPIRSQLQSSDASCELEFELAETGQCRRVRLGDRYLATSKVTRRGIAPQAYAIPQRYKRLHSLLQRHGWQFETSDEHWVYPVTEDNARAMIVLLEERSKFGLARFEEFGLQVTTDGFPVRRIVLQVQDAARCL